jgi:hypothetical protein
VLQVGVDLLDDRVMPVGLVGGDGVEYRGVGGGEEGVDSGEPMPSLDAIDLIAANSEG